MFGHNFWGEFCHLNLHFLNSNKISYLFKASAISIQPPFRLVNLHSEWILWWMDDGLRLNAVGVQLTSECCQNYSWSDILSSLFCLRSVLSSVCSKSTRQLPSKVNDQSYKNIIHSKLWVLNHVADNFPVDSVVINTNLINFIHS